MAHIVLKKTSNALVTLVETEEVCLKKLTKTVRTTLRPGWQVIPNEYVFTAR